MIYDSEMIQNGAVGSGMHTDGDANMNDLDASLFGALNMDGTNLIPANAGHSFIDSLTSGIGDELNLPFSELDSFVNGANGAGECSLAHLTSSLEFELGSINSNAPPCITAPQVPMGAMAPTRSTNCASPPGNSNQALRRLLTESQSAAPNGAANPEVELCNALRAAESAKPQNSDLNSTLLQLLIRQQIQQTEQRRILERLQSAILSNDKNALTAACLESEAKSPAVSVTGSVCTTTSTSASNNPSANANASMSGQQRTGHIQALLETSSPPPNGTAGLRQYAHLSESELRQTLISTDYQQQLKRGVNVNSSANAASNVNLVASTPQRNVSQSARNSVGNSAPAGTYVNGNGNANVNAARNTSGTGAVPLTFGGSFQPTLATGQPQLVTNIVKCETASSVGAYDRRRSGTSTAATSPTSRQPLSTFTSSIAGDSEDCGLAQDGDDDADSYSQPTVSGTGQAGTGSAWASVSGGARRSAHNVIEKRYRSSINDRIGELKQLVAANQPKIQKSGVLRKTVEYIYHLRSQNESLRNENAALKQALLSASANNGSSRFDAAVLSNGNGQNDADSMLIPADSPNAFECYADSQPVVNSQCSPNMRADQLMNAPSPPDTMMSSPDAEPPRQVRSPPRAAPRAGAQPSKQAPVAPKPVAPATQKLNAVLSGRQLACAALDRTKLLLCVAMVTFVAVNPLDLATQRVALGAPPSAVDHFTASSLGHAHAHGDFDFAQPHAGARLLSSYEAQPQLVREDSRTFSILRMATVWFINLLVILAILRRVLSSRCAKCTEDDHMLTQSEKLDADTDSTFARFKTQADCEFTSRQFDEARASYKLALAAAGFPCRDAGAVMPVGELVSFFVAYAVNRVRLSAQPSVPLTQLCAVYSRLLQLHLCADSESVESHATLQLALSTFRSVQRVHACGKNDSVADAYLAVTCATLALSRDQSTSSVVRVALRRVAALAFSCARNASPNDVLRNERFEAFLFDDTASLRAVTAPPVASLSRSLTQLLTGAFLRSLLVGCTSVLRDGDAEAAQDDLEELGRLCQPMDQECEYQFWHAATTLFVQFERNWHDAAQRGVGTLSRVTVRDQLKQQTLLLDALKRLDSLLQLVTTDSDGGERAVLASGRVASPRTVSIAHLVYRAVRALVVLSSASQPRTEAFEKLRTYLNSLSKTLQSVRKVVREEAETDSLELNVALCAAKWAVILRVMLCSLHREHVAKVSSTPQNETVQTRRTLKSKWIVECQTDLDTFAELNAGRPGEEAIDSARGDELEQFEGCLHELADSNPLQSVYVRMRVLAA